MTLKQLLRKLVREGQALRVPSRAPTYGFLALCLALYGLGAFYVRLLPANHDVAWLLYASGEVLGGAELYVDIIETNPPLIMCFMIAVKGLSVLTGVSDLMVFRMIALALIGVSLWVSWLNLRQAAPSGLSATIVYLVSIFLLIPWVEYHFGQREHLTIALVFPYLSAAVASASGQSLPRNRAILTGVLAGFGFSLKPFFIPVWLAVEGYVALRRSPAIWKRPENYVMVGFLLSYGLAILLFAPGYIELARTALKVYNGYWSWGFWALARDPATLFVLLVLLAHSNVRASPQSSELRRVLAVATVMFLAAVFMQSKGWDYHWVPVKTAAVLLLTAVAVDALLLLERWRLSRYIRPAALALTVVALLALNVRAHRSVRDVWARLAGEPFWLYDMIEVVEEHAPSGVISSFAASVRLNFPLVNYTGVRWGSRFNSLWMVPGLYLDVRRGQEGFPYRLPEERGELERYFVDAVITDLRQSQPDLLFVDRRPPGLHMYGFNWVDYFALDSRFREFFAHYESISEVGPLLIYKRVEAES
ncbi:MAG: hypothetical protein JSV86_02045 [Gemmatimonadota bacterium]|nr:MAG: hypothetical protein JSV86_02045 [Gemmatimonadota bacterium]